MRDLSFQRADILFKSRRRSGYANYGIDFYGSASGCERGEVTKSAYPAITYTPAEEIVYAAYPVSLAQLP